MKQHNFLHTAVLLAASLLLSSTSVFAEEDDAMCIWHPTDRKAPLKVFDDVKDLKFKRVDSDLVFFDGEEEAFRFTPGTAKYKITFGTPAPATLPGDANGDGQVTKADADLIVQHYLGLPAEGINLENSDVNGDGEITIADANAVLGLAK